jgi:cytochrome oxidase Cu insertion factor (SCO1/SenC/PrrC family)
MTSEAPIPRPGHRIEWIVWSALVLTVLAIMVAFVWTRMMDSGLRRPLNVLGQVPDFTLTNQFGQPVSRSNLLGQVWVADVIFTRCPVSCERMTQRMKALANDVPARQPVKFVSLTADPGYDTPPILKAYAEARGLDQSRWHLLTGFKRDVYRLSIDGLKFTVLDNDQKTDPNDLFIHSTTFVLVDKQGNIRASFEGTDDEDRKQLLLAVKKLAKER